MTAPGDTIGRYRIVRALGQGAMGEVFEAIDTSLDRGVALKIIKIDAIIDETDLVRFEREARLAAQLDDEHVVKVWDLGRTPTGLPFLAMELLEGRSLAAELAARGAVGSGEAIDWTMQICRGLAAAHARGIVHRDVKLSNVFVTKKADRVVLKVVDFGLAREVVGDRLTRTGTMLGTAKYMAPESMMAPESVDARADVWSVGVVLHRLITGEFPFEGRDAELARAIVTTRYEPPAVATPALRAVLARCLDPDREARFSSAKELRAALGALRTAPPSRRARPPVLWWAIGLAAVLVPAIAFLVQLRLRREPVEAPVVAVVDAEAAPPVPPPLAPEAPEDPAAPVVASETPPPPPKTKRRVFRLNGVEGSNIDTDFEKFEGIVTCATAAQCTDPNVKVHLHSTRGSLVDGCLTSRAFEPCVQNWAATHPLACLRQGTPCNITLVMR